MARRALANIATADLQSELKRREAQIDDLVAERTEFMALVDEIDAELAALGVTAEQPGRARGRGQRQKNTTTSKTARRPKTGKRPRNAMSLVEAMQKVMTGRELSIDEIMSNVKAVGYKTSSSNFRIIVSQALGREKKIFKRVSRGVYTTK